jgi:glycolate oxidase iron-sulfur subunit
MQHTIPLQQWVERIGPQAEAMVHAIETCVHCGFCLPVCPTYQVLGEEMDSPRGRITLMKSVLEGDLAVQEMELFIDRCLGCLACVTACPSGVQYGELVTPFRAYARGQTRPPFMERVQHTLVKETLPYPGRFRSAAALGRIAQPFKHNLPAELQAMLAMLPEHLLPARPLPELTPAMGTRRGRVALLAGCVQQALAPEINWATLRVLARNGIEVVIPAGQTCCGALLEHTGDLDQARRLARQNLGRFPDDLDAILTNAAGCGSGIKEYGMLFKGMEEETRALTFLGRVKDVSEFLAGLDPLEPPSLPQPLKAAYHDACHLQHAQGITEAPRQLLRLIPNLTLLEVADAGLCCGSAGTYNLEQPEIAGELGLRKAEGILHSGAEAVVTGNIGCMVQIRTHLQALGKSLPVYHTFELLDLAYQQT